MKVNCCHPSLLWGYNDSHSATHLHTLLLDRHAGASGPQAVPTPWTVRSVELRLWASQSPLCRPPRFQGLGPVNSPTGFGQPGAAFGDGGAQSSFQVMLWHQPQGCSMDHCLGSSTQGVSLKYFSQSIFNFTQEGLFQSKLQVS